MIHLRSAVAAVVVGGLVWVQGAAAQVSEDAKKVLTDSAEALSKVQSIDYMVRRYGTGQIATLFDFQGEVKLVRSATDKNRCPMLLKGQSKGLGNNNDPFWYSLDGNGKMSVVNEADKTVYRDYPLDQQRSLPPMTQKSSGDQVVHDMFFSADPFKNDLASTTLELLPNETFKDEPCLVVKSTKDIAKGNKAWTKWHISSKDHLPRRQEQGVEGPGNLSLIIEMWDVKLNTLKVTDLALPTPPGYKDHVWIPPTPQTPQNNAANAAPVPPPPLGLEPGKTPPDFTLKSAADGKDVTRDSVKGKVAVLAFLRSHNGPSGHSVAVLNEIKTRFKDAHVTVYAIMPGEKSDDDAKKFMEENKAEFPLLLGGNQQLAGAYKITGMPSFYVLGPSGAIVDFKKGSANAETLKTWLEQTVQKGIDGPAAPAATPAAPATPPQGK